MKPRSDSAATRAAMLDVTLRDGYASVCLADYATFLPLMPPYCFAIFPSRMPPSICAFCCATLICYDEAADMAMAMAP